MDSDVCGLLLLAAAKLKSALHLVKKGLVTTDHYIPLVNWTPACSARRSFGADGRQRCSKEGYRECSAIAPGGRAVSLFCMRLRSAPGKWLQVRTRSVWAISPWAKRLLNEGERLFRLFVDRYGLLPAIWTPASSWLLPPEQQSLFATMQDIQNVILQSTLEPLLSG